MWQWVAKGLVSKLAREQLAQAVSKTAEQTASQGQAYESAEPTGSVRAQVGVVMALAAEAGCLLDRMDHVVKNSGEGFTAYSGVLANRHLVVALSGPGGAAADRTTKTLIAGHNPDWILSAGFAGGLDARLGQGDLFVPNRFVGAGSKQNESDPLTIDVKVQPSDRLHVGTLLTIDKLITTPEEKLALGQRHNAQAVDMETLAIAQHCQQVKKRFLCARVISDTASDHLPDDLQRLMDQTSLAGRAGAVTGSLFRKPSRVKDLLRLKAIALECSETLAKFLEEIVSELDCN